jgi:hypothetical protein
LRIAEEFGTGAWQGSIGNDCQFLAAFAGSRHMQVTKMAQKEET